VIETDRIYVPITNDTLRRLQYLGLAEHEAFFARNPHLRDLYAEGLVAICLCQGAALPLLTGTSGVKDFDIWHFYRAVPGERFPYRARLRCWDTDLQRPVDYLKRVIPGEIVDQHRGDPAHTAMSYLRQRDTVTKRLLLQKPVVGLFPESLFGQTLWRGDPPAARERR
jgi:hypothetical protein